MTTPSAHRLLRWYFRLYSYALRRLLALLTTIRRGLEDDPTRILLDHLTPDQRAAEATIQPPLPAFDGRLRLLVIVPFRDRWDLTKVCLEKLIGQDFTGLDTTVVLVDNGSVEEATRLGVDGFLSRPLALGLKFRHLRLDIPFNFSRLNNLAVAHCANLCPNYILMLNNDVEIGAVDSLQRLVRFIAANPRVSAVGCTLLFPDGRIQHSFLAPGVKIVGAHPLKFLPYRANYAWFERPRVVPGITGAVFLIRAAHFQNVGGLEEALPTAYQDVDLSLKLLKCGSFLVTLPDIVMIHHETATRKPDLSSTEAAWMYAKWGRYLTENPYYPACLSRWSEAPVYTIGEGAFPWWRFA